MGQRQTKAARRKAREAIARWRYEQIAELLPAMLSRRGRAQIVREMASTPVVWPNGELKPIPRATAYRWCNLYNESGLEALQPRVRKDSGRRQDRLPDDVVERALELWANDPDAGLTFLIAQLRADPNLRLSERGIRVPKSTLQRRLAEHELYLRLSRALTKEKKRTRYVARNPHDIWHLDAKGPVRVKLTSGETLEFHVLTILDDATRDALAWVVVLTPDLAAAVRVFRRAAKQWGLPKMVYVDRASIFDSHPFREGLADLGAHRVRIRPRNPEANGKIEAYHKSLGRWFAKRLKNQAVVDLQHLQQLLDGVIETLYRDHVHRELKTSPRALLAGRGSSRTLPNSRIDDVFRKKLKKKAHRKTGEVDLPGGKYIVPDETLFGRTLVFLIDPEDEVAPFVVHPDNDKVLVVKRAAVRPEDGESVERYGHGPLQALYDAWQGKVRPNAEPGFGLPEIFALLTALTGRPVPARDSEAGRIHRMWRALGPLPKRATQRALEEVKKDLGSGRPLEIYLDAFERRVEAEKRRKT
jgi:transposase InsO family protein